MSLGSRDTSKAIARAERAVLAIKEVEQTFADAAADNRMALPEDDLAHALDAFAELEALTTIHFETQDITRAAVSGWPRLDVDLANWTWCAASTRFWRSSRNSRHPIRRPDAPLPRPRTI